MTSRKTVSVVLLSYNRLALLQRSLPTVLQQSYAASDIVVVDNPSPQSQSIADLVRQYPSVRLVPNDKNVGYAEGMNIGIRACASDYILLTEDDVLLAPNFVEELVSFAERTTGPALISGIERWEDDNSILFAGGRMQLGTELRQDPFPCGTDGKELPDEPYRSDYLIGNMMFASAATWKQLGGYRREFFMYFEDAEMSLRARATGVPIWIVPTALGRHFRPTKKPLATHLQYHMVKNYLATCVLYAPPLGVATITAKYFLYTVPRTAWASRSLRVLLWSWGWAVGHLPRLLRERASVFAPKESPR